MKKLPLPTAVAVALAAPANGPAPPAVVESAATRFVAVLSADRRCFPW